MVALGEGWEKTGEICWGEFFFGVWRVVGQGLQGGVGLEWNADTGENVKVVEKVGVKGEAEVGERTEGGWIVGIADG